MTKFSVNQLSTYHSDFENDVLLYSAKGFDAIGIWRAKLEEFGVDQAVDLLRENNLEVSSLNWVGGFTGSDGRGYREAIHDALDAIDTAALLGAGCLTVVAGDRNGHTSRHARRILTQALTELSEAAAARQVDLAIEPMHAGCGSQGCFLNDAANTLEVIREIGWPGVGIVLDTYHLAHDPEIFNWLPEAAPLVRLVQLADASGAPVGEQDRLLLGKGKFPLAEIIAVLENYGYEGAYEVELFGESVAHVRDERLLDHSLAFLESRVRTPVRSS